MVRQDIVVGLRNALERGSSMEQAKQSLINAGYSTGDITEAANFLTGGLGDQPLENPETSALNQQPQSSIQKNQAIPKNQALEPKKKFPLMLVSLITILVLLLATLVASIFFRESLITFFENLF